MNTLVKELNKPVNQRLLKPLYSRVQASSPGYVQIDLMDMETYKTRNKNFAYLLVIIDIYSRFGWAIPLKNKTARAITTAFKSYYDNLPSTYKLKTVYSDSGSEFKGSFSEFLNKHNINNIQTLSVNTHQVLAERWIRTLKEKIRNYWTLNNNFDWISHIQSIVDEYNNTTHSRMKEKPKEVITEKKEPRFTIPTSREIPPIEVNDNVRVLLQKSKFDKPTLRNNYSRTVYRVVSIDNNNYTLNGGEIYPRWKLLKSSLPSEAEITTSASESYRKIKKSPIRVIKEKAVVKRFIKKEGIDEKNIVRTRTRNEKKRG
jgi:hypothetical protein